MYKKVMLEIYEDDERLARFAQDVLRWHNHKSIFCNIPFRGMFDPVVRLPGPNSLKTVAADQELYIVAHGRRGDPGFYNSEGGELNVYNVAHMLARSGLTKQIKTIKLYCCYSGSTLEENMLSENYHMPLGHYFKQALLSLNFNQVTVYGYSKQLWNTKQAGTPKYDTSGTMLQDKNGRVILASGEKWVRPSKVRVKF